MFSAIAFKTAPSKVLAHEAVAFFFHPEKIAYIPTKKFIFSQCVCCCVVAKMNPSSSPNETAECKNIVRQTTVR